MQWVILKVANKQELAQLSAVEKSFPWQTPSQEENHSPWCLWMESLEALDSALVVGGKNILLSLGQYQCGHT